MLPLADLCLGRILTWAAWTRTVDLITESAAFAAYLRNQDLMFVSLAYYDLQCVSLL